MRATEEQTGRCSLGKKKKESGTDLQTQVSFLKYTLCGKQAASLPVTERPVCANTLESLSYTHHPINTHTNSQTFTWTWVNQSDLRGSFPAAIVFIG